MTLFVIGGITAILSDTHKFPPLVGVGFSLLFFGIVSNFIRYWIISFRGTTRIREAIAEESRKYSSRSPTPCTWGLKTVRQFVGRYVCNRTRVTYHVSVITLSSHYFF